MQSAGSGREEKLLPMYDVANEIPIPARSLAGRVREVDKLGGFAYIAGIQVGWFEPLNFVSVSYCNSSSFVLQFYDCMLMSSEILLLYVGACASFFSHRRVTSHNT